MSSISLVEDFGIIPPETHRRQQDPEGGQGRVSQQTGVAVFEDTMADGFYHEHDEAAATEDVRRMAALLRPQMSDLDDILKGITASEEEITDEMELAINTSRTMEEEDDDLDDEIQQLATSEEALREELEFAQSIGARLNNPYSPEKKGNDDDNNNNNNNNNSNDPPGGGGSSNPQETSHLPEPRNLMAESDDAGEKPPSFYTLQDHADYLHLETEKSGGWYYCDMTQFLTDQRPSGFTQGLVKDYCLPIPFRKLKRMYSGLMYHEVLHKKRQSSHPQQEQTPGTPKASQLLEPPATPSTPYLQASAVPQTPGTAPTPATPTASNRRRNNNNPPATPSTPAPPPPPPPPPPQEEPLPVRTVAIRIRPDVLCGAVMDAIQHAFEVLPPNCTTHIMKRQGGHLRGAVYVHGKALAYVADAQLCTQKNDELERRLIVRFYHIQDDPEAMTELGEAIHSSVPASSAVDSNIPFEIGGPSNNRAAANRHMKIACSLIQRLMAAQQQGGSKNMDVLQQSSWLGLRDTAFDSKASMQKAIGNHLESNYKACPSVREENKRASPTIRQLTLPSLSKKDWALLDFSWSLASTIMDELDNRECTYNTLATVPFGEFPSLPTLDVHYCSQMRRLSRENMVTHLLRSAKELDDYARTAEYNCAICITFLDPVLGFYGIPKLEALYARPLQDYPLDYVPPQVTCPPWGSLVMEALNQVAARTPTGDIEATPAVKMVFDAFTKQDDEEQAARLGRKNAQTMERLANMQYHQKAMIENIRDSYVYSAKASSEADNFLKLAQKASNAGRPGFPRVLQAEVPLLTFRVSLGASTSGTCYITANQILFATTLIPLLGSIKVLLFDLSLIAFQVDAGVASTLLNPFPNTMRIVERTSNDVLYSFRPSMSPARLHCFLKIVDSFAGEAAGEYSQVDHSQAVVEEDGMVRLTDTMSEDQLSI